MKHALVMSLAVILGSCAPQPGPYQMQSFWAVDCANPVAPDNLYLSAGNLDVGPGATDGAGRALSYLVGVTVTGSPSQPAVTAGNIIMEPGNRNFGVVKQIVITYTLSRSLGAAPKQYVINQTVPLTGNTDALVQLISPELSDLLINGLSSARDFSDTVDITANVEFRGTYTGDGHAFTTGSLDFPIRAYKSGDCPTVGRGGGGLDGGTTTSTLDTSCYYAGQWFTSAYLTCP